MTSWIQTIVCTAIGTSIGIAIGHGGLRTDDVIKTKHLMVIDDDDKTWVDVTDAGVQVLGAEKGDYSQIRAGQHPYMFFARDGETRTVVGTFARNDTAGLATYDHGQIRTCACSAGDRSIVSVYIGDEVKDPSDFLDRKMERVSAGRLAAWADGSAELYVNGKNGPPKTLVSGLEPNLQKGDRR